MGRCRLCSARMQGAWQFCPTCGVRQESIPKKPHGIISRVLRIIPDAWESMAGDGGEYFPEWLNQKLMDLDGILFVPGNDAEAIHELTDIIDDRLCRPGHERPSASVHVMLREWRGEHCIKVVKYGLWEWLDEDRREAPEKYAAALHCWVDGRWYAEVLPLGRLPKEDVENPEFVRGCAQLAVGDLTEALRRDPSRAQAYLGRAEALERLEQGSSAKGDRQQAVSILDRALQANPKDAVSYRLRAFARAKLGKRRSAISDLKLALPLMLEHREQTEAEEWKTKTKEWETKRVQRTIDELKGGGDCWWLQRSWPP